jgi:Rrf2 family iron-sulfur cluster assembly transcriptional regulator
MMDLAIHEKYGPVTLADISVCQGISLSYLEQIFAHLRRDGLISGTRGPRGGYRLARPADQITVADIINAVSEKLDTRCEGQEDRAHGERCLTHELWSDLSSQLHSFLDGITLAQFAERPTTQAVAHHQDTLHFRRGQARGAKLAS